MITLSEPIVLVSIITAIATITAAIIGASKYGKRKAETNMFSEFRVASETMQKTYQETIKDLRNDKEVLKTDNQQLYKEKEEIKRQRGEALRKLEQFMIDFDKMKNLIQQNIAEIALIKDKMCLNAPICSNRKTP